MITCLKCAGTSPDDAKFCIDCGAAIKANPYVEGTKRLADTIEVDGVTMGPYIPYSGYQEFGTSNWKPNTLFPHVTGAVVRPFVDYSQRQNEQLYFMYKADLYAILNDMQMPEILNILKAVRDNETIYYHGRKVVFMD